MSIIVACAFTRRLVADLRERLGIDAVWMDEFGGLHGGDEWWRTIVAEITDRDTFLVVLSPNALTSKSHVMRNEIA